MAYQGTVYDTIEPWRAELQGHFPHLSKPQIWGLTLWSLGIVLTRSCSLSFITGLLSQALSVNSGNLRQRLREWYWDASHKCGSQRRELDVETCFSPLLRWILQMCPTQQVALGLDATVLEDRFVVLCISVLYRGSAFPVAWHMVPAHEAKSWRPHWLRLLRRLKPAVPPTTEVLVLADRGLWARWLFQRIVRLGWHPFLRVNLGGTFQPVDWQEHAVKCSQNPHPKRAGYVSFTKMVARVEGHGGVRGTAFKDERAVRCTLMVYRDKNYAEPWLILTDLAPEQCDAQWYAVRAWIEHGFKFLKREGWHWHRTRIQEPERVKRHWLALAVALLWVQLAGREIPKIPAIERGDFNQADSKQMVQEVRPQDYPPLTVEKPRQQSLFRSGIIAMIVRLWRGEGLVLDFWNSPSRTSRLPLPISARAPT